MSPLCRWRGWGAHFVAAVVAIDCPSAVAVAAAQARRTRAMREALGRAGEDEGEKKQAATLEAWLGELEADATTLVVGEHGVEYNSGWVLIRREHARVTPKMDTKLLLCFCMLLFTCNARKVQKPILAELLRALGGVKASASLLGVPLGHNSSFLQGPAFAPPRIREAIWCGSTNSSTEEGKELNDPRVLTDVGDVPIQEIRDCGVEDDRLMHVISESVKAVMEEEPLRPLVLGGDHSISYPVVRAVSEKLGGPVDILHLDAHPDIYDCFEGNNYSHASSFARIMEGGYARRLLQVGLRSITKEGRDQGKRFGVEQYEMRTFSKDQEKLENLKLGEGVKGVYVSVDVDCLDPAFAPGVSHIEPGGLSFRDVLNILQNLQGDVVAADVVEFNPQRDTVDGMTAMVAAKLVRELTAKISK
ncbi:arginase 1, mitochondrial isoform X1 [Panicum hallii]|uniref:arginase 1, mitochondrial isoform X1 n=2 Tax=Panicum hallii TaxID=206008 RepID=UPI000DF4DCAD|nr:arginase 1, mitochondrial isoform X1 [Panicum hallii]